MLLRPGPDFRRLLAVVLCGAVLLPACVRPRAGVGVKALAADLIFGIPPVAEPVTPPNTSSTPAEPLGVVSTDDSRPRLRPTTTPPPREECPEADATEFPDEEASTSVEQAPFMGNYKWMVVGTQEVPQLGTYDLSQRKYSRQIRNVTYNPAAGTFFFETVEEEVVFGSTTKVISRWEVRPTEGIFLVRLTHERPNTSPATFNPSPAVLYLPLPVRIGATIKSVGIDPVSQQVLEHDGQVLPRQHVDACGDLVDSWYVDARQVNTSSRGRSGRDYNYGIATQLGGFIVFEEVETDDKRLKFTARLGQTRPGI